MKVDLLVRLQLLIVLCPGDSWSRSAAETSRQGAAVPYLHHNLVSDVKFKSGWFCCREELESFLLIRRTYEAVRYKEFVLKRLFYSPSSSLHCTGLVAKDGLPCPT